MNPKRTMNQALRAVDLSADAAAFVAAGAPGVPARSEPEPDVSPLSGTDADERTDAPARLSRPSCMPPARHATPPAERRAPVSMTFRLPAELPPALLRAALERKLRGDAPCTQQDIVAAAVRDWLARHGEEEG